MEFERHALDVVVIGAGLGGLSAAISCRLAGHNVTVLESAKTLSEIGAGLQITPNAARILRRFGMGPELEQKAAVPTSISVHRYSDGKVLAHEDNFDENLKRKYGEPFHGVHRADLQKIMYERCIELEVQVRLGQRVTNVQHDDQQQQRPNRRPRVVLESDENTVDADLVIGADGLWSRCRESLLCKQDNPLPTGDLAYRISLTADQMTSDPDLHDWITKPTVHFWIGPHAHAVGYSVRSGAMYNIVLLCPDDLPDTVARQHGSSVPEMRQLFSGWDPILTRFLDRVESVDKWKLMYRAALDTWTSPSKNFVLMGDACHPMLPYLAQGANSAIEDAAVLGRLLSYVTKTIADDEGSNTTTTTTQTQLSLAVELYESLRKTRSESITRETFRQREAFHLPDGPDQIARDSIFASQLGKEEATVKFPSRWTCPEVQPWLYGYDAFKEADNAAAHAGLSSPVPVPVQNSHPASLSADVK